MREMIKPALSLLAICFFVAVSLALVNNFTRDVIKQRNITEAEGQRKQVMHEAKSFKEIDNWKEKDKSGMVREAYEVYDGQSLIGYVFTAFPKGYGGEVRVMVGIGCDGRISGVTIGENKETPGLGSKTSDGAFVGQYSGKSIQKPFKTVKHPAAADNEIQAVSGATISSKAVTAAVQASAELGGRLIGNGGDMN